MFGELIVKKDSGHGDGNGSIIFSGNREEGATIVVMLEDELSRWKRLPKMSKALVNTSFLVVLVPHFIYLVIILSLQCFVGIGMYVIYLVLFMFRRCALRCKHLCLSGRHRLSEFLALRFSIVVLC